MLVDAVHLLDLGSVELGCALGEKDPVGEVGDVLGRHLTSGHGGHQIEAAPLEARVVVGVLDEQPCSGGAARTDETLAWPAVPVHDVLQPLGVGLVDANHLVRGLAVVGTGLALANERDQCLAGSLVLILAAQQLSGEVRER